MQLRQTELKLELAGPRRSQVECAVTGERYVNLYNLAPIGYLTIDGEGVILEANTSELIVIKHN